MNKPSWEYRYEIRHKSNVAWSGGRSDNLDTLRAKYRPQRGEYIWDENAKSRLSFPPATTPMCDAARELHVHRERLAHYRTCSDPRCMARAAAAADLGAKIATSLKRKSK